MLSSIQLEKLWETLLLIDKIQLSLKYSLVIVGLTSSGMVGKNVAKFNRQPP